MHRSLKIVKIMLICFCTKSIASSNSKIFQIHHEKVPISYADLLLIIETTSKTVNALTLADMKEKTLALLDQLEIADDKVRVALIQNGESHYRDPADKRPRSFNDIASVVKCKLNECNNPTMLRNKINEMELMEFTPCSLPILAAEQIIFKRQNGDRPDANNVVIFLQSFCCDDTSQTETDRITTKRIMETSTVFISLLVESACNGSFNVAKSYARNIKEYAFRMRNYDYSNKKIINVIQKVLSCSQKAEVGKCKWDSIEKACKRTLAIGPIENEKCAKAIDKPVSVETYFSPGSDVCAEVIDVECRQDPDKTYKLLPHLKQRNPNSNIEQNVPRYTPEYDFKSCLNKKANNFLACKGPSIPMPTLKKQTFVKTTSTPTSTQEHLTTTDVTLKTTTTYTSTASTQITISPELSSVTTQINQNATIPISSANYMSKSTASTVQPLSTSIIGTNPVDVKVVSSTSTGQTFTTSNAAQLPVDPGNTSSTSTLQHASSIPISSKLPLDLSTTLSTSTVRTSTTSATLAFPDALGKTSSKSMVQTSTTSIASKLPVDLHYSSSTASLQMTTTFATLVDPVALNSTLSTSTVQTFTTSIAPNLPVDPGETSSTPKVQTTTTFATTAPTVARNSTLSTSTIQTSTTSIAPNLPVDPDDISSTPMMQTTTTFATTAPTVARNSTLSTSTVQTSTTSIAPNLPVDPDDTSSTSTEQASAPSATLANQVILNSTSSTASVQISIASIASKLPVNLSNTLSTSTDQQSTPSTIPAYPVAQNSISSTSKELPSMFSNSTESAVSVGAMLTSSTLSTSSTETPPIEIDIKVTVHEHDGAPSSTKSLDHEEGKNCEQICNGTKTSNECSENVEAWVAHSNLSSYPCLKAAEKVLDDCREVEENEGCVRLANALGAKKGSEDSSFPLYAIIIIVILILIAILILAIILLRLRKKKAKSAQAAGAKGGLSTKKSITKEAAVVADLSDGRSSRSKGPKSPPIKSSKMKTLTGQSSTGGKSANAKSGATSSKKMST